MYKIFKVIIVASISLFFVSTSSLTVAQNYKGDYSGKEETYKDRALKPIPMVFSSKLVSTLQAKKLDKIYDNLLVSLWRYSGTDFIYQKKLYAHLKAERFQLTRYSKEFSGDLKNSMDNLNRNYANMMSDIDSSEQKYLSIKEGIMESDYEILEPLWEEKIGELREHSKTYFKMQSKFLNVYKNLVSFILKQGGSYYYKAGDDRVYFYKFGGYKFYGQSIDKLRKTSFEQRQLLRNFTPANLDIKLK